MKLIRILQATGKVVGIVLVPFLMPLAWLVAIIFQPLFLLFWLRERRMPAPSVPPADWPRFDELPALGWSEERIQKVREMAAAKHQSLDDALAGALEEQVSGKEAMWVIPATEFARVAELQRERFRSFGQKVPEIPDPAPLDGRFVLMLPIGFSMKLTGPIGPAVLRDLPAGEIPLGFVTDFASIPSPLQFVAGRPIGSYSRAALVHDWAYAFNLTRGYRGRKACDQAMLQLMRQDRTPPARRAAMYLGLRLFGSVSFWRAPSRRKKLAEEVKKLEPLIGLSLGLMRTYLNLTFGSAIDGATAEMLRARAAVAPRL